MAADDLPKDPKTDVGDELRIFIRRGPEREPTIDTKIEDHSGLTDIAQPSPRSEQRDA